MSSDIDSIVDLDVRFSFSTGGFEPAVRVTVSSLPRDESVSEIRLEDFNGYMLFPQDLPTLAVELKLRVKSIVSGALPVERDIVDYAVKNLELTRTGGDQSRMLKRYSRFVYNALRSGCIIVYLSFLEYDASRPSWDKTSMKSLSRELHVGKLLKRKLVDSILKLSMKYMPANIYLDSIYVDALKKIEDGVEPPRSISKRLAEAGLARQVEAGDSSRWETTYLGKMLLEAASTYRSKILGRVTAVKPTNIYRCLLEEYAENLPGELVKESFLTGSQMYVYFRLNNYFSSSPDKPFILYGVRGVGKTFTLKYVLEDGYRYVYLDKDSWALREEVRGEPKIEVFDDWHYLCEAYVLGRVSRGGFRSMIEDLSKRVGEKHVVLVSDDIPSAYMYKLPRDDAELVGEIAGLKISDKPSLDNPNIVELQPDSVSDLLRYFYGPEESKAFIDYVTAGRVRRLAKILKRFNGVPQLSELVKWVSEKLGLDDEEKMLIEARFRGRKELLGVVEELSKNYKSRYRYDFGRAAAILERKLRKAMEKIDSQAKALFDERSEAVA
ncbi:MAG: hypothetical protein LZ174_10555 [Thaumarchaeota archaeon]|jgi:hypothetical protein|nr:hypothetical protein [Candidatus Geocrenenecus arthurdayi]